MRPSATELLEHKFIANARDSDILLPSIIAVINAARRENDKEFDDEDDEDDDLQTQNTTGTVITKPATHSEKFMDKMNTENDNQKRNEQKSSQKKLENHRQHSQIQQEEIESRDSTDGNRFGTLVFNDMDHDEVFLKDMKPDYYSNEKRHEELEVQELAKRMREKLKSVEKDIVSILNKVGDSPSLREDPFQKFASYLLE